jgi:hypothetical protein
MTSQTLTKPIADIIPAPQTQPAPLWRWRTSLHEMLHPGEMETRHLFFTLRMIWNHSMPDDAKLHPYKQYTFNPLYLSEGTFYDELYMQRAIRFIGLELFSRDDIDPRFQAQLDFMKNYLRKNEHILPQELQRLEFTTDD